MIFSESGIAYDCITDPIYRQMLVAKLVAHQVSNQWFNGLTPLHTDYIWSSAALASFFEMYTSDKIISCH